MSIRKPSKQSASKSDHFEFFTYVYRRKNTQKSKFKKKMQINNKKCADSEYWKEKLDLNTILGVFKDIRFFFIRNGKVRFMA